MGNLLKKREGFTLIELLIVLAILAILASVAVPNYLKAREKAKDEAAQETLKTLKTALEMYTAEKGSYPQNITTAEDLKKALQDYWPRGINTGIGVGNLSDAITNEKGTKFTIISVGKDSGNCWQMSESGKLEQRNSPNID